MDKRLKEMILVRFEGFNGQTNAQWAPKREAFVCL